jgi:periplasmic protein TonB
VKYRTSVFVILSVLLLFSAAYAQQEPAKAYSSSQPAASDDPQPPQVIHREAPVYPQEARARRLTGTVRVEGVVDKQGNVINARVIQGHKIFWNPALVAIKGWRFKPATAQGHPVEQTVQIQLEFRDKSPALAAK